MFALRIHVVVGLHLEAKFYWGGGRCRQHVSNATTTLSAARCPHCESKGNQHRGDRSFPQIPSRYWLSTHSVPGTMLCACHKVKRAKSLTSQSSPSREERQIINACMAIHRLDDQHQGKGVQESKRWRLWGCNGLLTHGAIPVGIKDSAYASHTALWR